MRAIFWTVALLAGSAGGCTSAPPSVTPIAAADSAFAFRDPRVGAPPPSLAPRDAKALDAALAAIRRGDVALAIRELDGRRKKDGSEAPPLGLARLYAALASGERGDAGKALSTMTSAHPAWVAAVEAEADLAVAEERISDALERYRALLRLVPRDRRAVEKVDALGARLAASKRQDAEEALQKGDLDAARRAAHALIQLEPASPSAYVLLSKAASAGGKNEDAWTWAKEARKKAPSDRAVTAFAAEAAGRTGRWADAAVLWEGLAAADPSLLPKAEQARMEFRVQNLPEAARRAAESPRVTRAQLATLLWWSVPEFREAPVPAVAEIAVDVVDRSDRSALVRAIGLGFLAVSPETHRVGADAAVSRDELGAVLRRVAILSGSGRAPKGCLAAEAPSAASLGECGILSDTTSRNATGREALRALEKAARLGREGGTR
jgi:tetratricopeptide (TPR) repeat protein